MSDTIIAKGISKSFKRGTETIHAIQDVSLNVNKGEMLSIMGRSGSGKTTLLSCIGMLENIDSGSLALEGKNIKDLSEAQRTILRRELMGFIFQRFFLIPTLTAYENVA
ncbi:MAG: ATP-binding cassette domain-containing protein, partial [Caldisericales bacterium]|nr:ATP-binding cassette domain-containing protein [Caldisericales bacterium]